MEQNEVLMIPMNLIPEEKVNEDNLPSAIAKAMDIINNLEDNVSSALEEASKSQYLADEAKRQSANIFNRKNAIEQLQEATSNIAKAQIQSAQVQKISMEYQRLLGVICTYLFDLSIKDISLTRSTINILEEYLKESSEQTLSDASKKELFKVVNDLKVRQDLMQKYEKISKQVKEANKQIKSLKEENQKLLNYLASNKEQDMKIIRLENMKMNVSIIVSIIALVLALISIV